MVTKSKAVFELRTDEMAARGHWAIDGLTVFIQKLSAGPMKGYEFMHYKIHSRTAGIHASAVRSTHEPPKASQTRSLASLRSFQGCAISFLQL